MADIKDKWPWPGNVHQLGTFPEEVRALQELEKNPDAAPVAEVAPSQFLDPKRSSDDLRIGEPNPVSEDPAIQPELNHVVLRRLLMKPRKPGWQRFSAAVNDEDLGGLPQSRRTQMDTMLRREKAMLDLLGDYNRMAEIVYARLLSESKG